MNPILMTEEFWRNSQLSVAKYYGGCRYNGYEYIIVDKFGRDLFECSALAKKELCKDCRVSLDSYAKGRIDEIYKREKNYKYEGPTIPAFWPPCHYGGECTNPFHDCINCHRQSMPGINTTTGTSTAKVKG